jgi:HAD superfamily hydrolase (TIGR01509 family)
VLRAGRPLTHGRPQLVIFDCDGVLVDSEPISNRLLAEHLTAAGFATTTDESLERYMGGSFASMLEDIRERFGRDVPEGFSDRYHADLYATFDAELEAVAGIEAVLDGLEVATCVASSGAPERIRRVLRKTGLLERFEGRIFSAVEVDRGKPAPDLFLYAASRMGVEPGRCAVVEDSPKGVEAGVAAGMAVFGYAGRTPLEWLAREGVVVFSDMGGLGGLLGDAHFPSARDGAA